MTDNKQFSKELEKRVRKFTVETIQLCSRLPNMLKGIVIRKQIILNLALQLALIIGKQIMPGAMQTLRTTLKFVRVKPAKRNIGLK
jgi:hypothetical protein